jgi:hydroxybutyrate-dimer hydrolase
MSMKFVLRVAPAVLALGALTACGDDDEAPPAPVANVKPSYIGAVTTTSYNGSSDDLLTGGLGWDGLQSATPPALPAAPTAAEIRRRTIYTNYRALADMTTNGGYGVLYGPNVSLGGSVDSSPGAGKVAGTEYLAFSLESGRAAATLMVQVPSTFNAAEACIVTATSSGSRGVYGAVSAAGEWGLKRGCAVAYTDKGSGNGGHELSTNTVTLIDGLTANAATAGNASLFTANLTASELSGFNTAFPNRYAFKHAHSQTNSEKDWGKFTLQAIEFALYVLNEQFGEPIPGSSARTVKFDAGNTTVIAASVSNGAGGAIMAAEQDTAGLIDAVVAGEPQINVRLPASGVSIARGGVTYPSTAIARPLYDYTTLANLLQPCASHAAANAASPLLATVPAAGATARCAALAAAGIISGATFAEQAASALQALIDAGWQPESNLLHASHWGLQATPGVAVTYANAYSRAKVTDNLCGFSFATTSAAGVPAAAAVSPMASLFALGNGVPPTNGVNLVYNNATGGAILHTLADGDFAFAGANCLRQLWTGASSTVRDGVAQIRVSGNLRGKPAIILHGRADALVPVNFSSRTYFGANRVLEGSASKLSYIEVANAQHFEAFLGLAGYDNRFIPLHYYGVQAMNLMWSHLRSNATLPPSQVVRTTPRGGTPGSAPPISVATNLPPISGNPAAGNAITFNSSTYTVQVPD